MLIFTLFSSGNVQKHLFCYLFFLIQCGITYLIVLYFHSFRRILCRHIFKMIVYIKVVFIYLWKNFEDFVYLCLERREKREKDREKYVNWLPLLCDPTRNWICSLGRCPDGELNRWPLALLDDAPITPHESGMEIFYFNYIKICSLKSSIERFNLDYK